MRPTHPSLLAHCSRPASPHPTTIIPPPPSPPSGPPPPTLTPSAPPPLPHQDQDGRTALHQAVRYNRVTQARWLIQAGGRLDVPDFEGLLPLHQARYVLLM